MQDIKPEQGAAGVRYYYHVYGLNISSDICLDAINPIDPSYVDEIDLFIRISNFPLQPVTGMMQLSPNCWATTDHVIYDNVDSAMFYIHHGRYIDVMPKYENCFSVLKLVLQGYILNIALIQRQRLVLHGTTVASKGRALVICGVSGSGKSSISAALLQAGFSLVADDFCVINSQQQVELGFDDIKIWKQTVNRLDINCNQLKQLLPNLDKFSWLPAHKCNETPSIAAIFILKQSRVERNELKSLNGMNKLMPLAAEIYQPWISQSLNFRPQQIQLLAKYAADIPVYVFELPCGGLDISRLDTHAKLISDVFFANF